MSDAECSAAILPAEAFADLELASDPLGRVGFKVADEMSGGDRRVQTNEKVNVIAHTARGEQRALEGFGYATDVGVEAGFHGRVDHRFAVFGRKDHVQMDVAEALGHVRRIPNGVALSGLG